MKISSLAGKPVEQNILVNIPRHVTAYYTGIRDTDIPDQRMTFGFERILWLLISVIYLLKVRSVTISTGRITNLDMNLIERIE